MGTRIHMLMHYTTCRRQMILNPNTINMNQDTSTQAKPCVHQ